MIARECIWTSSLAIVSLLMACQISVDPPPAAWNPVRAQLTKDFSVLTKILFLQREAHRIWTEASGATARLAAKQGTTGYRILATLPHDIEANSGETAYLRTLWFDGTGLETYLPDGLDGYARRQVTIGRSGQPVGQIQIGREDRTDGKPGLIETKRLVYRYDTGEFALAYASRTTLDGSNQATRVEVVGADFANEALGLAATIKSLVVDFSRGTGSYEIAYDSAGVTEKGTFTSTNQGFLDQNLPQIFDPLPNYIGAATGHGKNGELLYKRKVNAAGFEQFDFPDGIRYVRPLRFAEVGRVGRNEPDFADVTMDYTPGGGVKALVTLIDISKDKTQFTRTVEIAGGSVKQSIVGYPIANPLRLEAGPGLLSAGTPGSRLVGSAVQLGNGIAGFDNGKGNGKGNVKEIQFSSPTGISIEPDGILIADSGNQRIRKLPFQVATVAPPLGSFLPLSDGTILVFGVIETIAGNGVYGFREGAGGQAQFKDPAAVVSTSEGVRYVAEQGGHRIRRIAADGMVSTVAGTGKADFADGPGSTAAFNIPSGLALEGKEALYVADKGNHCIRRIDLIDPAHPVTTFAGTRREGSADGQRLAATFQTPQSVAFDPAQRTLYVGDEGASNLRAIAMSGGQVTTVAGTGERGGRDGLNATVGVPSAIFVTPQNELRYVDLWVRRVRQVNPDGTITTVFGVDNGYAAEGGPKSASFVRPFGYASSPNRPFQVLSDAGSHSLFLIY